MSDDGRAIQIEGWLDRRDLDIAVQAAAAGNARELTFLPNADDADDVAVAGVGEEVRRVFAAAVVPRLPRGRQIGGKVVIVLRSRGGSIEDAVGEVGIHIADEADHDSERARLGRLFLQLCYER